MKAINWTALAGESRESMKEPSTIIDRTQEVLAWYQTKIGNYDKQLWEQSVEQRILKGLENRPKKEGCLINGLIDVDLVRGSAFTKAKPQHHWSAAVRKGFQRVVLFPFYLQWWRHHTSPRITKIICFIYVMQLAQLIVICKDDKIFEEVHLAEVLIPLSLLIFLGILHSQIVSTYGAKKIANHLMPQSRILHGTPRSTSAAAVSSSHRHGGTGRSGVRSSKVNKGRGRTNQNRTKSVNVCSSSNLSPGESGQFDGETTGAEAEKLAEFISAKNKPVPDPIVWGAGVQQNAHNATGSTGTNPVRRRHRSWRINSNDSRESPHRSLHSNSSVKDKSLSKVQLTRRELGLDGNIPSNKFMVRTVPSDEERPEIDNDSGADDDAACKLLTGHSEDVGERFSDFFELPGPIVGQLIVVEPSTASPVDSAFAESDAAKKSESGSSSRPSSASSRPISCSSSPEIKVADDSEIMVGCYEGQEVEEKSEKKEIILKVTPVSEESDCQLPGSMSTDLEVGRKADSVALTDEQSSPSAHLTAKTRQLRSRSASPTPVPITETLLHASVPYSCHESSNDDTYTSMSKRRVEFAQLFRLRSGRRPRRSATSVSGGCDGEDVDGFEQDLADESSDPEEEEKDAPAHPESNQIDNANSTQNSGPYIFDAERSPTHKVIGGAQSPSGGKPKLQRSSKNSRSSKTTTSQASETEYDRINSDVGSSDSSSESQDSDNGITNSANEMAASLDEDPFVLWFRETQPKKLLKLKPQVKDTISCYVWEDEMLKKSDLTLLDIGWSIIQAVERCPTERHYIRYGLLMSILLSFGPLLFRFYLRREIVCQLPHAYLDIPVPQLVIAYIPSLFGRILFGRSWLSTCAVILGVCLRCFLYVILFFLLCVAERTYAERLQYAKHFCHLTSSRRARKYHIPHFRLNKVSNIKSWLSLRSYLKKRGPQRSVECIITSCIYIMLTVLSILCVHLLQDSYHFLNHLINWDLILLALALGLFLLRFMTLGTKITKKFRNLSVLITEQINLYLTVEKKPHKKEELMLAQNVLKLAEGLLKELDGPFRICGWSMNPVVYNILKVVILSAFSAVLSEMLGFKLKLYKIKLNPINW